MANRDHSLDDGIIQAAYSEFLAHGFQRASVRRLRWLRRGRLQWKLRRLQRLSLIGKNRKGRGLELSARALFSKEKS